MPRTPHAAPAAPVLAGSRSAAPAAAGGVPPRQELPAGDPPRPRRPGHVTPSGRAAGAPRGVPADDRDERRAPSCADRHAPGSGAAPTGSPRRARPGARTWCDGCRVPVVERRSGYGMRSGADRGVAGTRSTVRLAVPHAAPPRPARSAIRPGSAMPRRVSTTTTTGPPAAPRLTAAFGLGPASWRGVRRARTWSRP